MCFIIHKCHFTFLTVLTVLISVDKNTDSQYNKSE